VSNYQLTTFYIGNEYVVPHGDRRIFGLPCRFPAKPSIFAVSCYQAYDRMRFFGMEGDAKNFLPGFFPRGREPERRRPKGRHHDSPATTTACGMFYPG
jgi:hypothetical protein